MPRSRNSRSASPQKSASAESLAEFERTKIYQNVHDIFCEAVDDDVIRLVLQECHFKEELCIEKLLMIAESGEEQKKYKSRLHSIAEGVFGSLQSQDHGQNTIPTASNLSPSEKVIRRPTKTGTNDTGSPMLHKALASDPQLHARGTGPSFYLPVVPPTSTISPDEIEMDLHFPQLPTKSPDAHLSSRSSSMSSISRNELSKSDPTKSALLSQAQSAYSQQYDDAEGSQRWEQYKEKLSEHYLVNLTKDNEETVSKGQSVDSAIKTSSVRDTPVMPTDLASPRSDSQERPRSASGRSFPVRLLSRSPETVLKQEKMPGLLSGQNDLFQRKMNEISAGTLDSSDLDETVLKCIYQVQGDLLDEKELKRKARNEGKTTETPSNRPSSQPMTLPTIGLSVDAVEFVPKAKPAVATIQEEIVTTTVVDTIPQPTSKTTKSNSVEINSGVKNIRNNSPSVQVVSPLTISPSLSPGVGLSPPSTMMNSPVANLTGSPMFITPKWGQLYHTVNRPPPLLASAGSRFMSPNPTHHLPPAGFRFTTPGPMPYSSRVLPVYTVAPPPLFRMGGVQQFVQHPNVQFSDSIEERIAVATGQPIMATSEASRLIAPSAGVPTLKVLNQDKIEKLQLIQQSGLKVLVVVRGLPGSGKSTLARALQLTGLVLSTDDYFTTGNVYDFNPDKLTEAHQWNRERTREAMKMGKSPIIIDNTNTQVWEFKPYINLALTFNYHIEIFEPDTPWKYNCSELARRTLHGVPQDQIQRMCDRYEHNITVEQIIKKRKSDSRLNGSSDDLEAFPEKSPPLKMEKTLPQTQDDPSKQTISVNETKNSKDALRLQTLNKGDDLRKQKSAESDSDSISSFHSGSLSNQSSRNASPKPLRPSLKPPGALQKMEKLKPSLSTKPLALKPSVLKRKRKEIKDLESKLSEETLQIVKDMVTEHVTDKIVSVSDIKKLEEELKALLQLLIVNNSEVAAGEKLISLKLEVLNQNSEIPEDINTDNADIEEDKEESLECRSSNEDDMKLGNGKVTPENGQELEVVLKITSNSDLHNLETRSDVNENDRVTNSTSLLNNNLYNEIGDEPVNTKELISQKNSSETKISSWKEIAIVRNDEGSKHKTDTEGLLSYASDSIDRGSASASGLKCAFFLGDTRSGVTVNDFELKYWGIVPTGVPEDGVQNEIVQNTLEDASASYWSEPAENSAKPQRKKGNKSSDTSLEASVSQTNDESVNVTEPNPDSPSSNELEVFDGSNEIDEEISNILGTCTKYESSNENNARPVVQEFPNEGKSTECAGTQETCENCYQDNGDQIIETVCSNLEEISEENSDTLEERSQIIVSSALNKSLKMLQDSYIESENSIASSAKLSELNMERKTIDNEEQSEKLDENTVVNSKIKACEANNLTEKDRFLQSLDSPESSNINYNIGIESNTTESFTAGVTLAKKIQEIRSSESLTTSEDSEIDGSVKSESDIEVTPLTSPQSSFYKKPSNQNGKKSGKRKMAANFKGPFLKEDDKEKFKTTSWSSFPIHGIEQITSSPSNSKGSMRTNINSVETITEVECFNCVTRLNQGGFIDSSVRYLTGNPRKMVNGFHIEPDKVNQEVTDILKVDKSMSTDDFVTLNDKESVEFLQTCFPKLPVEELECVLENCVNNVEWAINLLLDWKYDLRLSAEEKQKFTEGMAELKRCSSPENVNFETHIKGPKSLLDICFDYIEQKEIATREDIERQLIQTGKERLDRIEDDNMTKIRLHRSTSLTDTSVNLKSSPGENKLSVFRSWSHPGKNLEDTRFSEKFISKLLEYKVDGLNEDEIEQVPNDNEKEVDSVENYTDIETNNVDSETDISVSNNLEGLEDSLDWMLKPAMTMTVDLESIKNLEELFGPIGHKDDLKESLLVPLDRKTAWLMYQSVKRGIVDQRALQRKEQQQLREDEELARQLQEAENAESRYQARNQRLGGAQPASPYKKSTPLIGLSVQGTIPKEQEKIAWNGRNQSLAQIMREEKQIQEKAEEFERLIRQEGGDKQMATCLKRQKLYGKFPKLDKELLNDIFKANCFNLTETVASIEMSLGVNKPRRVSDTAALSDFTNDDQLMEATKQQSLQEMLDSYICHPVISKDYQDGTVPEYEDPRGEANLHFRLRNECFHKAREAYRRGLKQVASFYSQQGHQHTQKIKEANMRASDQILAERNVDIDKNLTLDLHGLHVEEAIAALNRIIPQKERERCKHITVMTGRGSHSRGGISRLRPAVLGYLKSSKYNYTELQTGVFKVSLKYRTPER